MADDVYKKAKNYALRVLTYRQRTKQEMIDKLHQKGYKADIIKDVITFLQEYQFIDDYKYACQWVEYRLKTKPMGARGIKYQLKKRGIDDEIIEKALSTVTPETELELARQLVSKAKRTGDKPPSYRKLAAMLQRRGFEYYTIKNVLSEVERQ
ncbi:regulatory protein RecX [Desulfofalx alkaliphila]|uniref:regulatory protein RecX n=1 Tax=Desulfofalx alkaliphila TaxID=105483 RepID=UPI0004E11112|nr:regulatory protein RecX [Desulfofalx alkaliphila]